MAVISQYTIIFLVSGLIQFYVWFYIGSWYVQFRPAVCPTTRLIDPTDPTESIFTTRAKQQQPSCHVPLHNSEVDCRRHQANRWLNPKVHVLPTISHKSSSNMKSIGGDELGSMKAVSRDSMQLNFVPVSRCEEYSIHFVPFRPHACVAVVAGDVASSLNLNRFNYDVKRTGRYIDPARPLASGFFKNVALSDSRGALRDKLGGFLSGLSDMTSVISRLLIERKLLPGADLVVMVANDGEIDIYMNFVCSCIANNISLHNVVVFVGSIELVSVIDASGATGLYHSAFSSVSRRASRAYLDPVFVDMMWYKAFAVWFSLELGYNVLFQDLDLAWMRSPMSFIREAFNNNSKLVAYLSDDGARSIRYSPFFANSGFYYLKNCLENKYLAWTVMTAFDMLYATGSHQNVFTLRLVERMDLSNGGNGFQNYFFSLSDFPSGVKYHHDKRYIARLRAGEVSPFVFHMCWTANKQQKVVYFKNISLWHVTPKCNINTLAPINNRAIYKGIQAADTIQAKSSVLLGGCCRGYMEQGPSKFREQPSRTE